MDLGNVLAELAVIIKTDTSKLTKGFADAEKQSKTFGQKMNKVGNIAGIASAAIVSGFAAATLKFADTADKLQEMSQRTGVSTKYLQQLGYAAKLTGGSIDGMETAIKRMQVSITNADEKTGKFGALLKSLQGLGVEDQFEMLADLLAEIEDPTERAAAAVELFGKSGTDLLPILMEGSAGIKRYKEEATKLGIVMGDETVAKGAKLKDSLDKLEMSFSALVAKIGSSMEFQKFIDVLTTTIGKVIEWADKNPKLIQTIFQIAAAVMVLVGVLKLFAIAQAVATAMSGWIGIAALAAGAIAAVAAVVGINKMFEGMSAPARQPIATSGGIDFYASGGIVPGTGPQLAMVHGGETIIPAGGTGGGMNIVVNVAGSVIAERDLAQTLRRELLMIQDRNYSTGIA